MVRELKKKEEFDQLMASEKTVIIDFTATWCGPCKSIGPKFVAMAESCKNASVEFVKVDVDECADIAEFCEISAMPTFKVFKNGKKVEELVGANDVKLKEMVERHSK